MAATYNIPLARPWLPPGTEERVLEVLRSGYLTEGATTRALEQAFADYVGVPHAVAVTSGTMGLESALRALGAGPGDEVVVPSYTYPATAAVVALIGADLAMVDITSDTQLVDYEALEAAITPRTKVLMPVSQFGNPLDYTRLDGIRERHDVRICEDAACALGAEFEGRRVGPQADIAVFSCHPRKSVTTGEGGMVVTTDDDLAEWVRSYKHCGVASQAARAETCFARIGTNLKLSNVLAALGVGQMAHIDEMLERRRAQAARYRELLAGVPGIGLPQTTPGGRHSWQTFSVLIDDRDRVMQTLRRMGIEVQIGSYALHMQPAFAPDEHVHHLGPLERSLHAFEHCLALPLYHELTPELQAAVVEELVRALAGR